MTQYVAFPRGINAGHPMKMAELRAVFESLGYEGVRTVIASGNVLFETKRTAEATLIREIEKALSETFGARIPVVIRTRAELERLAAANPFEKVAAGAKTRRPFVTFLKQKPGSAGGFRRERATRCSASSIGRCAASWTCRAGRPPA